MWGNPKLEVWVKTKKMRNVIWSREHRLTARDLCSGAVLGQVTFSCFTWLHKGKGKGSRAKREKGKPPGAKREKRKPPEAKREKGKWRRASF